MSDFSELNELAADLTAAPARANRNIRKALEVTARHIKDDWQQGAEASGLSAYARSVDYELKYPGNAIEAEIGPNHGKRQGVFGFMEDGGDDVHSAPQHAGRNALEANETDFEEGLEIAVFEALGGEWD